MPSSREMYKDALAVQKPITGAGQKLVSKSLNVHGRYKNTFLVVCDTACEMTVEFSWDQQNWYPLADVLSIAVVANVLKRVTLDDVFPYLRLIVSNFGAFPATLNAWYAGL